MDNLLTLGISELASQYRKGALSPVEVTEAYLDRIEQVDPRVHAYLTVTDELALEQARNAERSFSRGESASVLSGIPLALKDAFHLAGTPTTLGSLLHRDQVAKADSGVVRRLRRAGSVILGKANTAEFGQSATSENLLGPDTANPWGLDRTPGGSSGGSASAVAARLCAAAIGSDGGGSIRIPAAFCGVFGLKTSPGLVSDEKGFRAMTDFVGAGPMASNVADARALLSVLADADYIRAQTPKLKIAYCPRPEGHPVDPQVAQAVLQVASLLSQMGHDVSEVSPPLDGWNEIFGPLVLEDEHRERGHLLADHAGQLTKYARSALRAALRLDPQDVARAHELLPIYRQRYADFFARYDVLLTPTTAVPAFVFDQRPETIDGEAVDKLWGPFPFTVPFNVAGASAATLPCGLADGLPVGAQLASAAGKEALLLNLCEDLEQALGFDAMAAARELTPVAVPGS